MTPRPSSLRFFLSKKNCFSALLLCKLFLAFFAFVRSRLDVESNRLCSHSAVSNFGALGLAEHMCGLPELLEEVEYVITKDPAQKARLTPRMALSISSISVITEVQRQLALSTCNGKHSSIQPHGNIASWC